MRTCQHPWRRLLVPALFLLSGSVAVADNASPVNIDFEDQCPNGVQSHGACSTNILDAGGAQNLNISTAIGPVQIQGGQVYDDATNSPADESVVYATISGYGGGYAPAITITFPEAVTAFSVTVFNGETADESYTVSDNAGHSSVFTLPPNLSSGLQAIGFVSAGTVITISASDSSNWDFFIDNVSFTPLSASPELEAVPDVLTFTAQTDSNTPQTRTVYVQNAGPGSLPFTGTVVGGSPWLAISPAAGNASLDTPAPVTVTLTPPSKAGAYRDLLRFESASGTTTIPVNVFVEGAGSIITASPVGVLFNEVQGAGSSAQETIDILDTGSAGTFVNWTASVASGGVIPASDFLAFSSNTGQSQPGMPDHLYLTLNANAANLSPGVYYELVQIVDTQSQNSPQYVTAVLNVVPQGKRTVPQIAPAGLLFTGTVGQKIPSQNFAVNGSGITAQFYNVSAVSGNSISWLQATPAASSTSTVTPGQIQVSVDASKLSPGIYTGAVALTGTDAVTYGSVNVVLILGGSGQLATTNGIPAISRASASPHPADTISGCTPSAAVLTETGIPSNFTVPAGWPANIITTLTDDCGTPLENGAVVASFSNGDAPISLLDQGTGGEYIGTWQPSHQSNTIISLRGSAGNLKPAAAQMVGVVSANESPILANNGILNNFSYQKGAALAPGTIVAAFGSNLATTQTPSQVTTTPWPPVFENSQLLVAGFSSPLYYLSAGQWDGQLPLQPRPGQVYPAVGIVGGQLTVPVNVAVEANAPGVLYDLTDASDDCLTRQICRLIAQRPADGSLVSSASPAKPNEILTMYVLGMGATSPSVSAGAAAPGPDTGLAQATVQPTVTVGNQNAAVSFAGLTPGFVGLYQINFKVPQLSANTYNVVVTQGTAAANTTTLQIGAQ